MERIIAAAYKVKPKYVCNKGGGYHEWLTPENALAAVELAREEMKKIVKKYEAQGNRCKMQSLDNNETDNSYFWDGFENCAENILRDLQKKE